METRQKLTLVEFVGMAPHMGGGYMFSRQLSERGGPKGLGDGYSFVWDVHEVGGG